MLGDSRLPEWLEVSFHDVRAVLRRVLELPHALLHMFFGHFQLLQFLGRLKGEKLNLMNKFERNVAKSKNPTIAEAEIKQR